MGRSEERRAEGFQREMRAVLKTWPATPVGASLAEPERFALDVEVASFSKREQPGSVSYPTLRSIFED
jgi:hypothetical protein